MHALQCSRERPLGHTDTLMFSHTLHTSFLSGPIPFSPGWISQNPTQIQQDHLPRPQGQDSLSFFLQHFAYALAVKLWFVTCLSWACGLIQWILSLQKLGQGLIHLCQTAHMCTTLVHMCQEEDIREGATTETDNQPRSHHHLSSERQHWRLGYKHGAGVCLPDPLFTSWVTLGDLTAVCLGFLICKMGDRPKVPI